MRIPEVRAELKQIAARLLELTEELVRRPPIRRAPRTARRITPKLKREITMYARANPRMHMRTIGRHFGVDGGRVSEIVRGKRK